MKKIVYLILSLTLFAVWSHSGFCADEWREGIVNSVGEYKITIDKKTYNIDFKTVIKDDNDNTVPAKILEQKSCCSYVRFTLRDDGFIDKIVVKTNTAVW